MSRLFSFQKNSNKVKIQCYLHTSHHAPQGWYSAVEREATLRFPFSGAPAK
jgi:hypothetical protein